MYREVRDVEVGLSCEELGVQGELLALLLSPQENSKGSCSLVLAWEVVLWTSGGTCWDAGLQDQLFSLTNQEEQRVEFRVRLRHFEDNLGEVWSQALDAAPPLEMKRLITFASQGWEPHG